MTFPDFLCVGAQKAGTTWLHKILSQHPGVYVPERKEMHFFNYEYKFKSLRWYSNEFSGNEGRLAGDVTPAYSVLGLDDVQFMRRLMPGAKVILLLRNPVDRAYSAAKMHLSLLAGRDFNEISEDQYIEHFKSVHSLGRSDYIEIHKKYSGCFGPENVFVGFQEQIENDPKQLMVDIFRFLGVDDQPDWSLFPLRERIGGSVNSETIPDKYRLFLERLYKEKITEMASYFGSYATQWVVDK
ncbi:sulfotransferase family protein [Aestuariirhabdus sp. LZHN29]|uniref:sulfotransferase family protein n=1 Tax=Aestuariirhabdus sp. LZHN29 TaxID=3417462 RepID=UPI003CF34F41